MCLLYLTALSWLTVVATEQIMVKNVEGAQTVEIRDKNQILRTQYFPVVKKEVKLEVLGKFENPARKCDVEEHEETKLQNSTIEIRNGKMYKVTRVKKKRKKNPCDSDSGSENAQRRSSNAMNAWHVDEPKNMTKWGNDIPNTVAETEDSHLAKGAEAGAATNRYYNVLARLSNGQWQQIDENSPTERIRLQQRPFYDFIQNLSNGQKKQNIIDSTQQKNSSGDRSYQFWTNSHAVTQTATRKKEKLKKLLNLFTIVKFDNDGCYVDGLKGTCYTESECGDKGGRPMGPCAKGFGVCCYIERTCGQLTSENCTYFVNDGFPSPSNAAPGICALSVEKANTDVKQLRLELETFELKGPVNGTCLQDRFLITGQNRNSIVPDLCGVNTGQHMYVDVDAVNGPFNLNVVTMGQEVGRKFRVKVTQLRAGDALLAPTNCLQYFTELTGTIESFNYQRVQTENVAEANPGYFNNMNYDACIKKSSSFCSITYTNQPSGEPEAEFQLLNYDADGELLIPRGQAGAEVFNCPDDYVIVNGLRLCGDRLNDASRELDYTRNSPVTDERAGPGQLTVRTNEANVGRGFRLGYKQNPCVD